MVERWSPFANYDNFYQRCQPLYCSYTYTEKSSFIYMITTIIGLFGALTIIFRLILNGNEFISVFLKIDT